MRVYFLAEKSCALFVGGLLLGTVDGFERVTEIDPEAGVFCELKAPDMIPVSFVFDGDFLLSPPPQIRLYYTDGGVAVYCRDFVRADPATKIIWQERFGGTRLTLLLQGRLQLDFSNGTDFCLLTLPDYLESCKPCSVGREFLLEAENGFALIGERGEKLVVSEGRILSRGKTVAAEVPFCDSMGHTAVCSWENGALKECTVRTAAEPTEATFALALFESALIGADIKPFLSDALADKANSLRAFLGGYVSVVLTNERDRVGLVYPRGERIFDVRYYRVTLDCGKISNIVPEETK